MAAANDCFANTDGRLRVGSASARNMGAVAGRGDLVASLFIHKVGDERQVSDQSGQLAQRTLSDGFRHAPTLNRQIRTAAASLFLPSARLKVSERKVQAKTGCSPRNTCASSY